MGGSYGMKSTGEYQPSTDFERALMKKLDEILSRLAPLPNQNRREEYGAHQTLDSEPPWPLAATRGRKSKLPVDHLLDRRNQLIEILEQYCPEIIAALQAADTATQAAEGLMISVSAWTGPRPPILVEAEKYTEQLGTFLKSGRFHENLRNLANAMAGVPEMSWKRSFDLCTQKPPKPRIPLHPRVYRNFLHRNYPERLHELESAQTTEEVSKTLAKSRSKDPDYLKLRANPESVLRWLRDGIAGD
jgi:hypothetical protein